MSYLQELSKEATRAAAEARQVGVELDAFDVYQNAFSGHMLKGLARAINGDNFKADAKKDAESFRSDYATVDSEQAIANLFDRQASANMRSSIYRANDTYGAYSELNAGTNARIFAARERMAKANKGQIDYGASINNVHTHRDFPKMLGRLCDIEFEPNNNRCESMWRDWLRRPNLPVQECGSKYESFALDFGKGDVTYCKKPGDQPNYVTVSETGGLSVCMCYNQAILAFDKQLLSCASADELEAVVQEVVEHMINEAIVRSGVFGALDSIALHPTITGAPTYDKLRQLMIEQACDGDDCCEYDLLIYGRTSGILPNFFEPTVVNGVTQSNSASGLTGYKEFGAKGRWYLLQSGFLGGAVMEEAFRAGPTLDTLIVDRTTYRQRGSFHRCTHEVEVAWGGGFGLHPDACGVAVEDCDPCA